MKNLLSILVVILMISSALNAQSERYQTTMLKLVEQLDTTQSTSDYEALANQLERIANAEKEEWLPNYYLSYINMQLALNAMQNGDDKGLQERVDNAEKYYVLANESTGENSELVALQGYIYQAYLWIAPMKNGQKYSALAHESFVKSAVMNPSNPRPLMLRGMMVLHTPKFFGGGAEHALPLLQGAAALYKQEQTLNRGYQPKWGATTANYMLGKVQEELDN